MKENQFYYTSPEKNLFSPSLRGTFEETFEITLKSSGTDGCK